MKQSASFVLQTHSFISLICQHLYCKH